MRRNTKNNKVLRAITIGLATMIAVTSSPVEVFAGTAQSSTGEEPQNDSPSEETTGEAKGGSSDDGAPSGSNEEKPAEVTVSEGVSSMTSCLDEAADDIEKKNEDDKNIGLDPANKVLATIIVNGDGSTLKVEKVERKDDNGNVVETYNNVTPGPVEGEETSDVKSNLDEATKDLTGVYKDIATLQENINNFYKASYTFENGGTYEAPDGEGTKTVSLATGLNDFCFMEGGKICFWANKEKNVYYQIDTVPVPVVDENGVQVVDENGNPVTKDEYTVQKIDKTSGAENSSVVLDAKKTAGAKEKLNEALDNADAADNAGTLNEWVKFQNSADVLLNGDAENDGAVTLFPVGTVDSAEFKELEEFVDNLQKNYEALQAQAKEAKDAYKAVKDFVNKMGTSGSNATALHQQLLAAETKANALQKAAEDAQLAVTGNEYKLELLRQIKSEDERLKEYVDEKGEKNWDIGRPLTVLLLKYYIADGSLSVKDVNDPTRTIDLSNYEVVELGTEDTFGRNNVKLRDRNNKDNILTLEIGADFIKTVSYAVPTQEEMQVDNWSITDDEDSQFENFAKDKNGNFDPKRKAKKAKDGTGWIFANYNYDNRVVVNIKKSNGDIIGTSYFNSKEAIVDKDDKKVYEGIYIFERNVNEVDGEKVTVEGSAAEYTPKVLKWDTDSESIRDAKKAGVLKNNNGYYFNSFGTDGEKNYKNLIEVLEKADGVVANYTNLASNITAARVATGEFLEMLRGFSVDTAQLSERFPVEVTEDSIGENGVYGSIIDAILKSVGGEISNAKKAVDNAKKLSADIVAAKLRIDNLDPSRFYTNDDDDDDDSTSGSGSSSDAVPGFVLPGAGAASFGGYSLAGMTFDEDYQGVAGARSGRTVSANGSGVLGVRTEDKTEVKQDNQKKSNDDADKNGKKNLNDAKGTKVESNMVPLAATPFEEGAGMNWTLFAVAGAAAAGVIGYGNYKRKAALNEMDSAKKSKKK